MRVGSFWYFIKRAVWRVRHTPHVVLRRAFFEACYLPKRLAYPVLLAIVKGRLSRASGSHSIAISPQRGVMPSPSRVFDCITLFDGLDLLEIRLNILDDCVDYFVIVEATTTHSGAEKPLYFAENKARFSRFLPKIRHVVVDDMPKLENVVHRHILTSYQRDQIIRGLYDCLPNDIVYVSDFDEVPNPDAMRLVPGLLAQGLERIRFRQRMYYYFLNGQTSQPWWVVGTVATRFSTLRDRFHGSPDRLRPSEINPWDLDCIRLPDGGWHFSYLGGVEAIIRKIGAFEIAEMDREEYKTREHVLAALREGKDVFGRPNFSIRYVKIDECFPRYIRENQLKWAQHIMQPSS